MPLQQTSGNVTTDAYGGGVAAVPNYIEDVFSTYLYTGTGANITINNGIDLSTKGGLAWVRPRIASDHWLWDSARGTTKSLATNTTAAQVDMTTNGTLFTTTGFTDRMQWGSGTNIASWSFAKAPKFFDVVTYTGNGTTSQSILHSLGSVPGCIIIKPTNLTDNWYVYHRSTGSSQSTFLNLTNSASAAGVQFGSADPTSAAFTVGYSSGDGGPNINNRPYVAYVFAHNAGGFGLTGTDNVISCGSFTAASNSAEVNLGYEPQWVLWKQSSGVGPWYIYDTMRGFAYTVDQSLQPNSSAAEAADGDPTGAVYFAPTATGFSVKGFVNNATFIYIAIRRGPMKVPTDATKVFNMATRQAGTTSTPTFTSGFVTDMGFYKNRTTAADWKLGSRLQGSGLLIPNLTDAEVSVPAEATWAFMNGWYTDSANSDVLSWMFKRAPSYFDCVCYTGTGSARTLSHNLQAVPELILLKDRNNSSGWAWYYGVADKWISMPGGSAPFTSSTIWDNTTPTSSVFSVGANTKSNASGTTYVAYLWASLSGVQKIGTYVGNGSSQTINCGFSAGARFVMITNLTDGGRWNIFDTTRGIISSYDPVLRLDTNQAEITGEDPVDPDSSGFIVNVGGPDYTFVNTSGKSYLFLAIA